MHFVQKETGLCYHAVREGTPPCCTGRPSREQARWILCPVGTCPGRRTPLADHDCVVQRARGVIPRLWAGSGGRDALWVSPVAILDAVCLWRSGRPHPLTTCCASLSRAVDKKSRTRWTRRLARVSPESNRRFLSSRFPSSVSQGVVAIQGLRCLF